MINSVLSPPIDLPWTNSELRRVCCTSRRSQVEINATSDASDISSYCSHCADTSPSSGNTLLICVVMHARSSIVINAFGYFFFNFCMALFTSSIQWRSFALWSWSEMKQPRTPRIQGERSLLPLIYPRRVPPRPLQDPGEGP